MLSRVCDSFSIDPLRAIHVIQHTPAGVLEDIMFYRAFAGTVTALKAASGGDDESIERQRELYATPMGALVLEVEIAAAQWRIEHRDDDRETLGGGDGDDG